MRHGDLGLTGANFAIFSNVLGATMVESLVASLIALLYAKSSLI